MRGVGGAVIRAKLAGAKLMVIDSRRHRVAESADFFLQLKPGTEPILYGAMAKVIVDRGLMNLPFIKAHCRGYEQFLAHVSEYDLLAAADSCGVPAELIGTKVEIHNKRGNKGRLVIEYYSLDDFDRILGVVRP